MLVIASTQRKPIILTLVCLVIGFCFYLSPLRPDTSQWNTSIHTETDDKQAPSFKNADDQPIYEEPVIPAWENTTRARAAFVILTRNSELDALRKTMQQLEARFNRKFNYPYVFLNDEEFTEEFRELTSGLTSAKTQYGVIPREHWSYPDWIDIDKADQKRKEMGEQGVIYGDNLSYRHMCRFESGFFFRHPLMEQYDYYWRVEPNVEFFCDLDYDPFLYMQENNKKYGWTISLLEYESTIPSLWQTTKDFMEKHPEMIPKDNLMRFVSDDNGDTYNLCHFWSNFEIGDLNFLRSREYMTYFEYLDRTGGFFYERWGDAPVHSIAVAMFLNKSEVHFFDDIGYKHDPFMHCPLDRNVQKKCHCNTDDNFDFTVFSCMNKYLAA
ncbi:glycosyltransferase family 15 protein [Syncephalastrum racemosum]|uniref:Glycosyltransferase family 15 protein n=1 Tax=Syncephalastrum racemosum TaxID=13706 RepID=A0A1X2HN04_SYNRA|nr:glycosyltransferase family 15 protein [Syncephalastrum racemosum]